MLHKSSLDELALAARFENRRRVFALKQRMRLYGALGAFVRTQLGWHMGLSEKERAEIKKRAAQIVEDGGHPGFETEVGLTNESASQWVRSEAAQIKALERLAPCFPVWEDFGKAVRGFGPKSFMVIVAEAGNLSNYPTYSALWKRMGLAVIDSERQRKKSDKEAALRHGYNPARRSEMYQIGDTIIKGNRDGKYRTLYLKRKEIEAARGLTKMHAHRRAQRYMEKQLLRDLWGAWNGQSDAAQERARETLPTPTRPDPRVPPNRC